MKTRYKAQLICQGQTDHCEGAPHNGGSEHEAVTVKSPNVDEALGT